MKAVLLASALAVLLSLPAGAAEVKERANLPYVGGFVYSIAFSPDDKTFAVSARLWPKPLGDTWGALNTLSVPGGNQRGVAFVPELASLTFTPDSTTLVAVGTDRKTGDQEILFFKVDTLKQAAALPVQRGAVHALAISRDGKWLASGGSGPAKEGELRIWNLATRKERLSLAGHTKAVVSVTFSPDGKTLASASADKTVKFWDATTGKVKATLEGHEDKVSCVCFSPDGKRLASGSWDRTIRFWDPLTGKSPLPPVKHDHKVQAIAFSPDGKFLAAGGGDGKSGELRLGDAKTGKETTRYTGHKSLVTSVAFRPNGKVLASGAIFFGVKVWDVPSKPKEEKDP